MGSASGLDRKSFTLRVLISLIQEDGRNTDLSWDKVDTDPSQDEVDA